MTLLLRDCVITPEVLLILGEPSEPNVTVMEFRNTSDAPIQLEIELYSPNLCFFGGIHNLQSDDLERIATKFSQDKEMIAEVGKESQHRFQCEFELNKESSSYFTLIGDISNREHGGASECFDPFSIKFSRHGVMVGFITVARPLIVEDRGQRLY